MGLADGDELVAERADLLETALDACHLADDGLHVAGVAMLSDGGQQGTLLGQETMQVILSERELIDLALNLFLL